MEDTHHYIHIGVVKVGAREDEQDGHRMMHMLRYI